ncbi:galactosyl transferase GMA12/MNN10 family-domain-containing protein [Xylaria bambusicola]|uniref:galactosyl transferase GMA12/MNN10 family-domain-containing protein n=1 Tax=Xylaria bambusicola TaxID=326684 RepID=UPI002008A47D|nr:galactosyl transferase GMA12/MNN10 family-domain-containing protein [Xylaria bambusicola]KAI0506597.1 galactosyl transferase GMA12/MNN10 family-domain-containing protein [Xylaria bambusicola]
MHLAYPPRKDSHPAPYRRSRFPVIRRSQLKTIVLFALAILGLIWLFSSPKPSGPRRITGKPPVVVVTVFDDKYDNTAYSQHIKDNRIQYAEKHGYGTFIARASDYDLAGAPDSWSKVVAMRHAITKFPDCKYVWYLDQHALIMSPNSRVEEHVMGAQRLEEMMLRDHPVVPPESIIKTFSHLKASDVDLAITQDKDGLATTSVVLRNGEWAKFFLDTWFDPMYRSYNFQKAETHALEHIVQWHPTILSKLAIVPQRAINAYSTVEHGAQYRDGDIAVVFAECSGTGATSCANEAEKYSQHWRASFGAGH